MKALTLWQPWATLVAIGAKRIETRSWPTNYRGPVAIHASKTPKEVFEVESRALWPDECPGDRRIVDTLKAAGYQAPQFALPLGAIIAVVDLVDCWPIVHHNIPPEPERSFGDYTPGVGRYGWTLANVRQLSEPIPCRGALGLWTVPPDVLEQLKSQGVLTGA